MNRAWMIPSVMGLAIFSISCGDTKKQTGSSPDSAATGGNVNGTGGASPGGGAFAESGGSGGASSPGSGGSGGGGAGSGGEAGCNLVPLGAAVIQPVNVAGTSPVPAGGKLVDGTYHATKYEWFDGGSDSERLTFQQTIRIRHAGTAMDIARGGDADFTTSFSVTTSGSKLTLTGICDDFAKGLSEESQYSVVSGAVVMHLFQSGVNTAVTYTLD